MSFGEQIMSKGKYNSVYYWVAVGKHRCKMGTGLSPASKNG